MSSFGAQRAGGRRFTSCISSKNGLEYLFIDGKRVSRTTWHAELDAAKAAERLPGTDLFGLPLSEGGPRLNDRGQCPRCNKKPSAFKRPALHYHCFRCNAEYDAAGVQFSNYWWIVEGGTASRRPEEQRYRQHPEVRSGENMRVQRIFRGQDIENE